MSKSSFSILALLSSLAVSASAQSTPSFAEGKIELPPLSLVESVKHRSPLLPQKAEPPPFRACEAPVISAKPFSSMPIITPRDDIDAKMLIKVPDPLVDYKMIVIGTEIEAAGCKGTKK